MQQFAINWLAVIAAGAVRVIVGMLWYSPMLFRQKWMSLTGVTADSMQAGLAKAVPLDALASLVMSFVLLHAVHYAGANTIGMGVAVGFFNWLGLVAASHLAGVLYEKRPFQLYAINMGGQLVALCIMGAILAVWI